MDAGSPPLTASGAFDLGHREIEAHARAENFPVALRILTRSQRRHLMSIYGFARLADEIGDSDPGDRTARLDALSAQLSGALDRAPADPIVEQIARTIRELSLPVDEFERLIEANRRDQLVHRYQTYEELLGYCELSANPIGRLVLRVFGEQSEARFRWSDSVCTGLQLAEHWQDVAEDRAVGRVYLPGEDLVRFGCSERDLVARSSGPALRDLLRFESDRARALLDEARPLVGSLAGRARLAICGFAAGGMAALDAIAARNFDVLAGAPRPRRRDLARHFAVLAAGRHRS